MSTRKQGAAGGLVDAGAERRRVAERAERVAAQAEAAQHRHTRADDARVAAFARQRAAEAPDAAAGRSTEAGDRPGRDRTVTQLSATRRTRVRR